MKRPATCYSGLKSAALILMLHLSFSMIPLTSTAAVSKAPESKTEDMNSTIQPESSSEKPKQNDDKNLDSESIPLGKMLYENHCVSCHESLVHTRGKHKARTYSDIQYWVGRWSNEVKTNWSSDEIDTVVEYLNDRFYHY